MEGEPDLSVLFEKRSEIIYKKNKSFFQLKVKVLKTLA